MHLRQVNEEVFFADERIVKAGRSDIEFLKEAAGRNRRKRVRLCAHRDVSDVLHEMLIVHKKDAYIRPHKHPKKSESLHIIEGSVELVIFDEAGDIAEVIRMGDYSSGNEFYCRISDPCYHTLLIKSEFFVFHEVTNGPFKKSDTIFAPWAPDIDDISAGKEFMDRLSGSVSRFLNSRKDRL